ncbi:uncharacterized protein EAF01_004613 [Botrytis porri]|uniref:Uncharacterized protein n=1 Tax=Botrytis porri TaxID=87229 RepID=A0A4Z1L197_9HELO|nr:uncharacterized protein EAF01_004613 [Botrytis porri]KAF7907026.1 hypothetical protein EAF01_004613 [Botrytis porri]TGO90544.1 hypothetical protein BPOR_0060g00170 [Botrytis porri]
MEESDYESFLVDDEGQELKYPPLELFPPDQEIICQYLGDISPFPRYLRRGIAPLEDADTFTGIVASLLFLGHPPLQLPLRGLLKDTFSSDPHENFYEGAVEVYEPELDRLLRICIPTILRKRPPSEHEADLDLRASNPASNKSYAVANFLELEPDLDLPASISLSKRLFFAGQDFLNFNEPEEP